MLADWLDAEIHDQRSVRNGYICSSSSLVKWWNLANQKANKRSQTHMALYSASTF